MIGDIYALSVNNPGFNVRGPSALSTLSNQLLTVGMQSGFNGVGSNRDGLVCSAPRSGRQVLDSIQNRRRSHPGLSSVYYDPQNAT